VLDVEYSSCRLRSIRRLSCIVVIVVSCIVPVKLDLMQMTGLIKIEFLPDSKRRQ
jgi:hypothetical protein